jgi:hypothetical protein
MTMKISLDAEPRIDEKCGDCVPLILEELGARSYVRLTLEGREYDIDYREFWAAARAVCIDAHDPQ